MQITLPIICGIADFEDKYQTIFRLTYLVCTTVLIICGFILYCYIRRKLSSTSLSRNDLLKLHHTVVNENQRAHINYADRIFEI